MADETTDVSNMEQLVFVFRWIDAELNVYEEFMGLYQAQTIYKVIKDVLLSLNLGVHKAGGQCYDGASTMSGVKGGVAKMVCDDEPRAVYRHCYGHALNFAAGDMIKGCKLLKNCLDTTHELIKLIKFSPKRDGIFKRLKEELKFKEEVEPETSGVKTLCPTRWTVRADSLQSVLDNYRVLQDLWDVAYDESKDSEINYGGFFPNG